MAAPGCHSSGKYTPPELRGPAIAFGGGGMKMGRPPEIDVKTPETNWDLTLLDVENFTPAGARVIEGDVPYPGLFEGNQARFDLQASFALSSPDASAHLGIEEVAPFGRKGHWLVLRAKDATVSEPIVATLGGHEALWSPRSDRFAVNAWIGHYAREFFIVVRGDEKRISIDPTPVGERHFPVAGISHRTAARAYRWTQDGDLVVRALTQQLEEPYSIFGREILVSFQDGPPRLTFLRGFIKE